jgi:[acyl-carrier-protein] S-malonyltransferase
MSIAFVFPGQGSQAVGMGKDLMALPAAQKIFAEADEVLGFALSSLMFTGPKESLDDTINTQPALFTMSAALYAAMKRGECAFVAGHSLGQLAALYVAGVFTFADGLRLVRERGRVMKEAGAQHPGGMAALIGLDDDTVKALCETIGNAQVANYNSPGQVIVSGKKESVAAVMQEAKARKAKLVTPLDVSIAAHSMLMTPAVAPFTTAVNATPMHAPRVPIIANLTAEPLTTIEAIRQELVGQLTASVQWTRSVQYMASHGVDTFVEIGSGKVLTGLIKRIVKDAQLVNITDVTSLSHW